MASQLDEIFQRSLPIKRDIKVSASERKQESAIEWRDYVEKQETDEIKRTVKIMMAIAIIFVATLAALAGMFGTEALALVSHLVDVIGNYFEVAVSVIKSIFAEPIRMVNSSIQH